MIMQLHTRSDETVIIEPKDVIIVEGIFVLEDIELRNLMDIKLLCRHRCRFTYN